MKQLLHIFIGVILFGLSACQRETTYPLAMQQAESLMNTRPDSALHLLQGMADSISTFPEETQMYYHLLSIQAKDKQYITHTSDSLINHIVEFYDDYGNNDRLMMAYFYQGSTYRDMNDAPRALKAFHQAIDAGKGTKNLTLLGQTYGQMGTLLSKHQLYNEALEVYRKNLYLYQSMGENRRIPLAFRNIARMYSAISAKDSAIHFYEKAYKMTDDTKSKCSIASELGCLYYEMNYAEKAKSMLYPLSVFPYRKENAILYLGLLYHANKQKDSARYFFNQIVNSRDLIKKSVVHECLALLEEEEGNKPEATFHQLQHKLLQDSISKMMQSDELENQNLSYNYARLEKAYAELKQEKENSQDFIFIELLIGCTSCIVFIVLLIRKKKGISLKPQNNAQLSTIFKEKIFIVFQKAGRNETNISEEDWLELHKLMEKELSSFFRTLAQLAQEFKMSQQEIRLCFLLKLGFTNTAIAHILHLSKSAISHSQSRLYKKITGNKENASKMRLFIENL